MQVRALYDFAAEPGSGELPLTAGDILTVHRQDVGDGWWEGSNERGVRGLFPESYVEPLATGGPPVAPPPPLPAQPDHHSGNGWTSTVRDTWDTPPPSQASNVGRVAPVQKASVPASDAGADDFDDDWSDDDSVGQRSQSEDGQAHSNGTGRPTLNHLGSQGPEYGGVEGDNGRRRPFPVEQTEHALDGAGRVITTGGGAKKSINRFSKFVQSGMEAFILNHAKLSPPPPHERVEIALTNVGPVWASNPSEEYTCRMSSYKKSSKYKGLKSFITYEMTPSFAQHAVVSRRYKHFDWLHAQLESKFTFMLIPLLPEKQMSGRFEEDFVERRMRLLQLWVNKICRHPVMSKADVWMHFLTCHSEESKEWKKGKRKAERDEYIGGNFFFAVSAPAQPLDPTQVERRFDMFTRKTKILEEAVRAAYTVAMDSAKHMRGPFRREFLKYADAFMGISQAVQDETQANAEADQLSGAVKQIADRYENVAKLYDDQPKYDLEPMMDELFVYKGMLAAVPHIAQMQKDLLSRLREYQKLTEEGKMAPAELETIRSRVDTVSYAMLAEINHFEQEHIRDIKHLIKNFLSSQVSFYDNIRKQVEDVERMF